MNFLTYLLVNMTKIKTAEIVTKYLGQPYGCPYNCLSLVVSIRNDLGLKTPYLANDLIDVRSTSQVIKAIAQNRRQTKQWKKRKNIKKGMDGDLLLMSQWINTIEPIFSHVGVFINSSVIHCTETLGVCASNLDAINHYYPGIKERWYLDEN